MSDYPLIIAPNSYSLAQGNRQPQVAKLTALNAWPSGAYLDSIGVRNLTADTRNQVRDGSIYTTSPGDRKTVLATVVGRLGAQKLDVPAVDAGDGLRPIKPQPDAVMPDITPVRSLSAMPQAKDTASSTSGVNLASQNGKARIDAVNLITERPSAGFTTTAKAECTDKPGTTYILHDIGGGTEVLG